MASHLGDKKRAFEATLLKTEVKKRVHTGLSKHIR